MKRRPTRGPQTVATLIASVSDLRPPKAQASAPVPAAIWEMCVGSRIARRARPVKLERGVLFVRTATATWANELSMLSDTIVGALRERGIAVSSLRFFVGEVEPLARPSWREERREAPGRAALPRSLKMEIAKVQDLGLRGAIAAAAAASLGFETSREEGPTPRSAVRAPRSAGRETAPPGQTRSDPPSRSRDKRGSPSDPDL